MMKPDYKETVPAIQMRLINLARKTGKPFGDLLLDYGMERFLYRLSEGLHRDEFILKGGMVFRGWGMVFRRPTRDLDARDFTENAAQNLVVIIQDICQHLVEDDGMVFDSESVSIDEVLADADYRGMRVSFNGALGRTRIPIQIDISFIGKNFPRPVEVIYPTLLGMPAPRLFGYPPEVIAAEKLHTMVIQDEFDHRMKDFFDVWQMTTHFNFEGKLLQRAVRTTFQKRNTPTPQDDPVTLTPSFFASRELLWQTFLQKFLTETEEYPDFHQVGERMRAFFLPVVESLRRSESFNARWQAGETWKV